MLFNAVLTGYFDSYKKTDGDNLGLYHIWGNKSRYIGAGSYNILLIAAVYASLIGLVISAILLIIAGQSHGTKLSEAKSAIKKAFLITLGIFSVSAIISVVVFIAPQ